MYIYVYVYIHIYVYHNHRVGLFGHRPVLLRLGPVPRSSPDASSRGANPPESRRQPDGWMDVSIHLINQSIFYIYIYIIYI